jgi:hypothetical protein
MEFAWIFRLCLSKYKVTFHKYNFTSKEHNCHHNKTVKFVMYFVMCKSHYTVLQCSTVMAFIYREQPLPPTQWYGGAMLAILENSSVTNKGTKVRTYVHSESCCLRYKTSHATASVRIVTWATVCWFVTNGLGRPLFCVNFQLLNWNNWRKTP